MVIRRCFASASSRRPSRISSSLRPLITLPKTWERCAQYASARCSMTRTNPPPSVGRNAAVPFTARASIDARMNPSTASKAVFCDRKRRSPHRTMTSAAKKTMTPRRLIWRNVSEVASRPSPSSALASTERADMVSLLHGAPGAGGLFHRERDIHEPRVALYLQRHRRSRLQPAPGVAEPVEGRHVLIVHRTDDVARKQRYLRGRSRRACDDDDAPWIAQAGRGVRDAG